MIKRYITNDKLPMSNWAFLKGLGQFELNIRNIPTHPTKQDIWKHFGFFFTIFFAKVADISTTDTKVSTLKLERN